VAWPSDVIVLIGHSEFGIGDTLTEDKASSTTNPAFPRRKFSRSFSNPSSPTRKNSVPASNSCSRGRDAIDHPARRDDDRTLLRQLPAAI